MVELNPKIWSKLDYISKIIRALVNITTLVEGAIKKTRFILGVRDDVGAGKERRWDEENNLEGWTKTEGLRATGESVTWASIKSVRIWYKPISERILSQKIMSLKLSSSTDFKVVVTNRESIVVYKSIAKWVADVLSDWGDQSKNSRNKDDTGARILIVVAETIERKVK